MSTSIVEYFSGNEASRCGYCKGKNSSYTHGMWAHLMSIEDYQDLIDRGWRRSGRYCYKPTLDKTCCPQYTIRSDSQLFKPSKSQKRVIKRFRNYIIKGADAKESFTPAPVAFDIYESDGEGDVDSSDLESGGNNDQSMKEKANKIEKKLKMECDLYQQEKESSERSEPDRVSRDSEAATEAASGPSPQKHPKPGSGPDPDKPKCRKRKELRRERALKKLEAKGIKVPTPRSSKQPQSTEKSLEDLLTAPFPENSKHKFEMRLVLAQTTNEEFMKSFEESLQVYRKYQVKVHLDSPKKCSPQQFTRFLCNSSLIFRDEPFVEPSTGVEIAPGHGAFHQQYLIDGKIVCVGVIDILTTCMSSVYLYYDPDYSFLSLGTLSSLFEIVFVRSLAKIKPALKYYYMGYYIHSCPKMRYKAQYLPSEIVCPETLVWVPVEKCLPILDKAKYGRLNESSSNAISQPEVDLDNVGVLYQRQAMQYGIYRSLRYPVDTSDEDDIDDKNEGDNDEEEVREYSNLVGNRVSQSMLLYRS